MADLHEKKLPSRRTTSSSVSSSTVGRRTRATTTPSSRTGGKRLCATPHPLPAVSPLSPPSCVFPPRSLPPPMPPRSRLCSPDPLCRPAYHCGEEKLLHCSLILLGFLKLSATVLSLHLKSCLTCYVCRQNINAGDGGVWFLTL